MRISVLKRVFLSQTRFVRRSMGTGYAAVEERGRQGSTTWERM